MSGLGTKSLNKQKQVESLLLNKDMKLETHPLKRLGSSLILSFAGET